MRSPFLEFSIRFYGRPGVAPALLELQDRDGIDVNMFLFALWAASTGKRWDDAAVMQTDRLIKSWRDDIVVPLRSVRRALRETPRGFDAEAAQNIRRQIKEAELEAEFLQQNAMAECDLPPSDLPPRTLAAANVESYAAVLDRVLNRTLVDKLLNEFG